MSAHSSLENLKIIIRTIRNTPGLYDFKHDDFLVFERREQCWENVANSVNLKVDDLKSRWRVLRDRYVRYQRKLMQGRIDISSVRFPFFEQMKFLDPFIKRRNPKRLMDSSHFKCAKVTKNDNNTIFKKKNSEGNTSNPSYNDDEDTLISVENKVNYNHENEEYLIGDVDKSVNIKTNFNNIDEEFGTEEAIFVDSGSPFDPSLNQEKTQRSQDDNTLDEDGLFGKSLGMSLKKLSRLNNVRAKAEIYQVLQKYIEFEEI